MHQERSLHRVPLLRINLLQIVLAHLELAEVLEGARLTDEYAMRHLEISGLVLEAVDAVSIELVFSYSLSQEVLKLQFLRLRGKLGHLHGSWLSCSSLRCWLGGSSRFGTCGRFGSRWLLSADRSRGFGCRLLIAGDW